MERVDFHVHSYGNIEDRKTIDLAHERNISAVAIFKRGGEILHYYDDLISYGEKAGVRIITGSEFYAKFLDQPGADLVALDYDHHASSIHNWIENLRKQNEEAATKQFELLLREGFSFDKLSSELSEKLLTILTGKTSERAWGLSVIAASNSQNSEHLNRLKLSTPEWNNLEKKHLKQFGADRNNLTAKILWTLYFAPGKEGFIATSKPDEGVEDFISAVHAAKGVVLYSPEGHFSSEIWGRLRKLGINGVMGWHASELELSRPDIQELINEKYLILGGSDYDPSKKDWQLGTGRGGLYISKRRLEDLQKYPRQSN